MSGHDDLTYLNQMREYAVEIIQYSQGRSRTDLDTDRMYMLATCRLLEMRCEAGYQLPRKSRDAISGIPWGLIIGLRHRLVHAHDKLNHNILWGIVSPDLPPLVATLDSLLDPPKP